MNDVIYQHGIKGMRWGVRRTDKQLGHDVPKRRKIKDMDYLDAQRRLKSGRMSQDEYDEALARGKISVNKKSRDQYNRENGFDPATGEFKKHATTNAKSLTRSRVLDRMIKEDLAREKNGEKRRYSDNALGSMKFVDKTNSSAMFKNMFSKYGMSEKEFSSLKRVFGDQGATDFMYELSMTPVSPNKKQNAKARDELYYRVKSGQEALERAIEQDLDRQLRRMR